MRICVIGTIAFIILFTACERKANLSLPYEGDKIVVNTLIQADSPVYIRVTQSQPAAVLNDLNFKELSQAQVTLIENGQPLAPLSWKVIAGRGYFVSALPAMPGKRYTVTAAATGLTQVSGTDTMPPQPDVQDLFARKTGNSVRFTLIDPAGEKNYYRVRIYSADTLSGVLSARQKLEFRVDPSLSNNFVDLMSDTYYRDVVISDERINGKTLQFVLQTRYQITFDHLIAEVCGLTEGGYKYLRAINNLLQNEQDSTDISETVKVYSNIQNGYGIVAGIYAKRVSCKVQ